MKMTSNYGREKMTSKKRSEFDEMRGNPHRPNKSTERRRQRANKLKARELIR